MKMKKSRCLIRLLLVGALSASAVGATATATVASATPAQQPRDLGPTNGKLLFEGWAWQSCYVPQPRCTSSVAMNYDIWSANPDGTGLTNLTRVPGVDADGQWSPDGSKIVFNSNRNGSYDIFVMDADGSDQQQLTDGPGNEVYPTWSPNGRMIAYEDDESEGEESRNADIVIMSADGAVRRRVRTRFHSASSLAWSPDGRQIAFTGAVLKHPPRQSPEDRVDIFLMRSDGSALRRLTSGYESMRRSGGANWSPDGSHLIFEGSLDPSVCKRAGCDDHSIFTIRRDGHRLRRIPTTGTFVTAAEWSPDGTTIAYTSDEGDPVHEGEIWLMDSDGDNQRRAIAKPDTFDYEVDWQPIPIE